MAFVAGVEESARVAESLGCRNLIVLSGDTLVGRDDREQHAAIVSGLRKAAPVAAEHDVTLLLEPLNTRLDHVGYFLDSTRDALDIVEAASAPNVKLVFDIYHSVMMGELPSDVVGIALTWSATCTSPMSRAAASRAPAPSIGR